MSLLARLFSRSDPRQSMAALYGAVVAQGRNVHWYATGKVPDTLDGRFDMIAAALSLVLLRLEHEDQAQQGAWLTELFVDDMDGQLRQIGIGDVVVGKYIGQMMSALGGRLGAYRAAFAPGGDLGEALARNLYRGEAVNAAALAHVETRLRAFADALNVLPL
ncbi:MAG: ubiquinol-cytochrome C chaperone family protein, partial [Sphingobium sp.]